MPWSNQSGGPRKPGNPGPWGQGPGGGGTPPDLEEFLRRGQDRLRQIIPGGSFTSRGLIALILIGLVIWGLSGFYTVQTSEIGLNFIFGRYTGKTSAGLNYNLPAPIGSYEKLEVTTRMATDVGYPPNQPTGDVPEESLMLTGDQNIADVKFRVNWQIDPARPEDYAFNVRNPSDTVKAVAESAMREIVGRTEILSLLSRGREGIEPAARDLIQKILDQYKAGVLVLEVQLQRVSAPQSVIAAFLDVPAAQRDQQTLINQAETYRNNKVPEAGGKAARIVAEAEGYRQQTVAEARGQAARYLKIYEAYKEAPVVRRERMYLETMERVLGAAPKIILDDKGAGVVPYLPLGDLMKKPVAQGAAK
ncbi:MAG: FtsH protease activity modulator HflK [Methylobacteriaceae bacterium]|nr:FtsH protease activity modulator HflK [Methylobacteriaceae bacterium]